MIRSQLKLLIFLALTVGTVSANASGKIFMYRVNHAANYPPGTDSGVSGRELAAGMGKLGLDKECVDLRETGTSTRSNDSQYQVDSKVTVILNRAMTKSEEAALKKSMCPTDRSDCTVSISFESHNIADLSVRAFTDQKEDHAHGTTRPKVTMPLGQLDRLPAFNSACKTGEYADSWNNNASTPEARALLEKIGIDISQVRDFGLVPSVGKAKDLWSFGFPDHSLNKAPKAKPRDVNSQRPVEGIK